LESGEQADERISFKEFSDNPKPVPSINSGPALRPSRRVGNGFVASLARPGGNISGLAALDPELSGKRLELLKETVPKLSRVAVLGDLTIPGSAAVLKETELTAGVFKGKILDLDIFLYQFAGDPR
jgi:hypothetical protein